MVAVIEYFLTGGAGNADPDASFGGTTSTTNVSGTALNNLFDNVQPPDILGGDDVNYRAISVVNTGDATAKNIEWFLTDTTNAESILATWLDAVGTQTIGDEDTEPTGASGNWTTPLTGTKESLGDLAAAAEHRIWFRRTVDEDAENLNADLGTFHVWAS